MTKLLLLLLCMSALFASAQNVGIGTKRPLSKLHVAGDLRVDSLATQKVNGLVLHDKAGVLHSLKFSGNKNDVLHGDGSFAATVAANAWLTTGNTGTDSVNSFLGTIDDRPLRFRVFNSPAGEISAQSQNTSLGVGSLQSNTTGQSNTAFGRFALLFNTTGTNNTAMGTLSLARMTKGLNNTAVGTAALAEATGDQNTAVGSFALARVTSANWNTAVGFDALGSLQSGISNVAIGPTSQSNSLNGSLNIAIGYGTLFANRYQSEMVAIGTHSLYNNSTGKENVGLGAFTLYQNESGIANTAIGYRALYSNTFASRNTAVGSEALYTNILGASNVALGTRAMYLNKYGHSTVAIGDSALVANNSGNYNTAIGERGMYRNNNGNGNVAVGYVALGLNITGSNNTAIGSEADVTATNFSNATAIGYGAKVNASNKVRIGNAAVTKIEGQVPFTTPSDGRFKYNVREDVSGLDFIMRLRPVTYQFNVRKLDGFGTNDPKETITQVAYDKAEAIRRTGFIAQEVEKAAYESGYNFSGVSTPENAADHYSLSYESFVVPLVKGMQEQQIIIKRQSNLINVLDRQLQSQQEQINTLIAEVQRLKDGQATK